MNALCYINLPYVYIKTTIIIAIYVSTNANKSISLAKVFCHFCKKKTKRIFALVRSQDFTLRSDSYHKN